MDVLLTTMSLVDETIRKFYVGYRKGEDNKALKCTMCGFFTCGTKENHSPPSSSLDGLENSWSVLSLFAMKPGPTCISFINRSE